MPNLQLLGRRRDRSAAKPNRGRHLPYPAGQAALAPQHRALQAQLGRHLRERPSAAPQEDRRLALELIRELSSRVLRRHQHPRSRKSLREVSTVAEEGQVGLTPAKVCRGLGGTKHAPFQAVIPVKPLPSSCGIRCERGEAACKSAKSTAARARTQSRTIVQWLPLESGFLVR